MKNKRKQGNKFQSLLAVLILMVMLAISVLQPVFAQNYEAGKKGDLTLILRETDEEGNHTPVAEVGLTLYKVGSIDFDGNVHFVIDDALGEKGIDFNALSTADDWFAAAEKLAGIIEESGVSGVQDFSNEQGKMTFTGLEEGMYLVVQSDNSSKVTVSPMLISIPFADSEQGWLYEVQVYPKVAVRDEKKIQVTKRVYYIDENMDPQPMVETDAAYKIGIFLDKEGTIPFRDDYSKDIRIKGASSGTAVWMDVPDGTYYVFELDENQKPLQQNNRIDISDADEKKTFYYNVTGANEEETDQTVIGSENSAVESISYVNNYYLELPDDFYSYGHISIIKKVMADGKETTADNTFYAGIFEKDENDELVLLKNMKLKQNGVVTAEFALPNHEKDAEFTYTVLETDKDGKPVIKDAFPYIVSGEGDVVLTDEGQYNGTITITNSIVPEQTVTPTPNPSATPIPRSSETPVPGNHHTPGRSTPSGGTSGNPVKTGDETPVGVWAGILAAAIVIGGAAGFAVRRRKK
ncbi:LPXTG cell wall anchor domain-containing protein [Blautia schinkii]|uniref:pilin N-terminal domain-containing protein n=1 Tax=Blautia schinkii TaxID=180164 RepID=UPI00156D97D4|nr:pilin N-terminal domain-containing protein [Blautia schinkii]NSG82665.1 LPXTG cell wall anchor domain-containing protein [Blautia schinkii]NSK23268.1 LPXTG cell wall anchor domain-containing protein [Blautia schinkii]NSK26308.1 LPXTG cell wall anchor domain-containing protein [Blautia schinkii]NSK32349.1 LPXTG cell wall anchor domain-containing protein [Blautia schinkii]NSK50405.1 LPXTG cell wall anchor domain-containing protein [Blautia schinkii]